jgi:hypothetical protein
MEIWKKIPIAISYEVSNMGRIRSYRPLNGVGPLKKEPRLVNTSRFSFGYVSVGIRLDNGYKKTFALHRLILLTFCGDKPSKKVCAHLNGKPDDNRLENLAYVTPVENMEHKVLHGTSYSGERHHRAKLKSSDAEAIRRLRKENGLSYYKIAKIFNLTRQHIRRICIGRSWNIIPKKSDKPKARI